MGVYRRSRDYSDNSKQQFYVDSEERRRSSGNNCGEWCRNGSRNESRFENNFFYNNDATDSQNGDEFAFMEQESAELIWVKESCNIEINTTDTQAGISLQAGLQLAIALVLRITIGDSDQSEAVSQELIQQFDLTQSNRQKIYIYNTKDARVTTTDLDLAVNIQALLQLLLALVIIVDIL